MYVNDHSLIVQHLASINPDAMHQHLPPAFGALHFAPCPVVFPFRLPSDDTFPRSSSFLEVWKLLDGWLFGLSVSCERIKLGLGLGFDKIYSVCCRAPNTEYTILTIDKHQRENGTLDDCFLKQLAEERRCPDLTEMFGWSQSQDATGGTERSGRILRRTAVCEGERQRRVDGG